MKQAILLSLFLTSLLSGCHTQQPGETPKSIHAGHKGYGGIGCAGGNGGGGGAGAGAGGR